MSRRVPILLFAVAAATSAALLLSLDSKLTFLGDSWDFLVGRRGWSPAAFLAPFHEQLQLGTATTYKLLVAIFGMDSATPFFVVSIGCFIAAAALLFTYLRPRVGDWLALTGGVLVLFMGAASEDLLWEFQLGFFASVAAGLGVLLALDREDRRGDAVACVLLVVALAFASIGVAFLAAALADLATSSRPRRKRLWIALAPLALYAAWWLGWNHSGGSATGQNLAHLPGYVFNAAAAGIASLLGRDPLTSSGHPPLAAQLASFALVGAVGLKLLRERRLSRGLAVALALVVGFWVAGGLVRNPSRYPEASRYQYPSGVFLLILAAELIRGARLPRVAWVAIALVAAAAVSGGVSLLRRDYDNFWHPAADTIRTTLGAADVAEPAAPPDAAIEFPPKSRLEMAEYVATRDRHGSPALTEAGLVASPAHERELADLTIADLVGLRLAPPGSGTRSRRCRTVHADFGSALALGPGRFALTNRGRAQARIRVGRFSDRAPVGLGPLPAGSSRILQVPDDASPRPWRLVATKPGVVACRA